MNDLKIEIWRDKRSYDFRADKSKPDSFENNWLHNSIDRIFLFQGNKILFTANCQSVANYCFGAMASGDKLPHGDTIAPGKFTVRCFAEPRNFHGEIHAITNATDLDGQRIDRNAMQISAKGFQNGRWLIHDRFSKKIGRDTNYAWSAGCFILSSFDLAGFNEKLKEAGVKQGDRITGEVIEQGVIS
ncbi:MAG: hypothetical protein NC041_07165 [Bacteroides sp.]|nr:hypothetical protein [Prevotella sp.]MCM1407077.1 hypothetical protein [Treponema brennaborense]MCM1470229.1 hypothetical protein [Bacteroides sp.]